MQYTVSQTATEINSIQKHIARRKKLGECARDLLLQKTELEERKSKEEDVVAAKRSILLRHTRLVGNYVHDTVPIGSDEANNEILRAWAPEGFDLGHTVGLSHHDVLWRLGGYDPVRGVKLVGHRGYCLTGYGVFLYGDLP